MIWLDVQTLSSAAMGECMQLALGHPGQDPNNHMMNTPESSPIPNAPTTAPVVVTPSLPPVNTLHPLPHHLEPDAATVEEHQGSGIISQPAFIMA